MESGNFVSVSACLLSEDEVITDRIGVRKIEVKDGVIYVNKSRLNLKVSIVMIQTPLLVQ